MVGSRVGISVNVGVIVGVEVGGKEKVRVTDGESVMVGVRVLVDEGK